ncbi:MAG TPA: zinc ribbon domain-containing protein [Gemmatimonadales bacterium]|jgi:ribosomal protein L40E|nr:zinc ribbon domain-containing protein [Gemmatimonadales bacterium]
MTWEAAVAALVGLAAVWTVLQPLLRPARNVAPVFEPLDPEETPKGIALAALKEIEFDRETGKLSDADYELLKSRYTAAALDALRAESAVAPDDLELMIAARTRVLRSAARLGSPGDPLPRDLSPGDLSPADASPGMPSCSVCGPRPEPDAVFCSSCGRRLPVAGTCDRCGAPLGPDSQFCEQCGSQVAA